MDQGSRCSMTTAKIQKCVVPVLNTIPGTGCMTLISGMKGLTSMNGFLSLQAAQESLQFIHHQNNFLLLLFLLTSNTPQAMRTAARILFCVYTSPRNQTAIREAKNGCV